MNLSKIKNQNLCTLQVYLFTLNEQMTLAQSGKPPIGFADLYHSASRTAVSGKEVLAKGFRNRTSIEPQLQFAILNFGIMTHES